MGETGRSYFYFQTAEVLNKFWQKVREILHKKNQRTRTSTLTTLMVGKDDSSC